MWMCAGGTSSTMTMATAIATMLYVTHFACNTNIKPNVLSVRPGPCRLAALCAVMEWRIVASAGYICSLTRELAATRNGMGQKRRRRRKKQ